MIVLLKYKIIKFYTLFLIYSFYRYDLVKRSHVRVITFILNEKEMVSLKFPRRFTYLTV